MLQTLRVKRIYKSIQNTGPNAGRPVVILELGGKKEVTYEDAMAKCLKELESCNMLLITGEEPFNQNNAMCGGVKSFNYKLKRHEQSPNNLFFELETGGTKMNPELMYWDIDSFLYMPTEYTKETAEILDMFLRFVGDSTTVILDIKNSWKEFEEATNWIKNEVKYCLKSENILINLHQWAYENIEDYLEVIKREGFRLNPSINIKR